MTEYTSLPHPRRATTPAARSTSPGQLHRNLVVLRAGNTSLHPAWYTPEREFDIVVDAFGTHPEQYEDTCDELHRGLGETGSLAQHRLFTENPRYLRDYDRIWIPDDDILATTADINRLFALHQQLGFWIAQPALSRDSHFAHSIVVQHEGLSVRQTNFVESMVPIFTSEALRLILPTLAETQSGWGLDSIWHALVEPRGGRMAVYDCVTVQHTRAPGANSNQGLGDRQAQAEAEDLVAAYGISTEYRPTVRAAWDSTGAAVSPDDLLTRLVDAFPHSPLYTQRHEGWDAYGRTIRRALIRAAGSRMQVRHLHAAQATRLDVADAPSPRRNLVVLRAGNTSLHPAWYTPEREFDIVVDAFGTHPEQYEDTCDELHRGLGETGSLAQHRLFTENPRYLRDYDRIWIPDDDIETSTAQINALFRLHAETGVDLAQPALTEDSYFTHSLVVRHSGFSVREVNFVETMVPLFTAEALAVCLPTLAESRSGWGLEVVWQSLLKPLAGRSAVFDCLPVRHTRPPGANGMQGGSREDAAAEQQQLVSAYSAPPPQLHRVLRGWDDSFSLLPGEHLDRAVVEGFPITTAQKVHEWDFHALRCGAVELAGGHRAAAAT